MAKQQKMLAPKPEVTEEVASPVIGADLRVEAKVHDALDGTEKGAEVAAYFGIGGEKPLQPLSEVRESDMLLNELRNAATVGADLSELFGRIADHANDAMIDPDALRALMYRKAKVE